MSTVCSIDGQGSTVALVKDGLLKKCEIVFVPFTDCCLNHKFDCAHPPIRLAPHALRDQRLTLNERTCD